MHGVWSTVAVAPVVGVALMAVALRPRLDVAAARRLAVVRAALTVGASAVVTVEVAGAWDGLAAPVIGASWLGFVLAAGVLAWLRVRRQGWSPATAGRRLSADGGASWSAMDRGERLMVVTVGGVLVADLVVALLAEPNNFDSQTYHLPRVEHWVAQRDLQF